jgi:hypothetical protein
MKTHKGLLVLSGLIAALALIAAGAGILGQQGGNQYTITTIRGETVEIWGHGLYRFDAVGTAAQEIAQDAVTLCLGIPLLLVAMGLVARGTLRGQVLLAGTLGYFLYTYTSMAMLTAYNELFLVYVALFSLSLFAFILAVRAIDLAALPAHFSAKFPRRAIAGFLVFIGAMLALMWLGRIVPGLVAGTPPVGLANMTTLVIQAMDLGIIAPAAILAAGLLLRRAALGYLLAAIVLVKGFSLGAAITAMVIGQMLVGVTVSPIEAVIFPVFTIGLAALMVLMLRSLSESAPVSGPSGTTQPASA